MAFDGTGNVFVASTADSGLYKFSLTGGSATGHLVATVPGRPIGLAMSKTGRLYATLYDGGQVVELNPSTGAVVRVLASVCLPAGIATDPLSGALFVSTCGDIERVASPEGTPAVTSYLGGTFDGLTFGPDGTLFAEQLHSGNVVRIDGTDKAQPAASSVVGNVNVGDGIALVAPAAGQPLSSVVVNANDGHLVEVDLATGAHHDVFSGGSRGDFVATGPDGCLYVSQSDSVLRVSRSNGSCPFVPSGCATSTVPGFVCQPPTAKAGPDQTVVEGSTVTLDGSASTSGLIGGSVAYAWTVTSSSGPPITLSSTTAAKPTFKVPDNGAYRITLTVTDGYQSATATTNVTVTNGAPVMTVAAQPTADDGVAMVTAGFTDPGIFDTHTATFDWGDGSNRSTIPAVDGTGWGYAYGGHRYTTTGTYTVKVFVTDKDGGVSATTTTALNVGGAGSAGGVPLPALWANNQSVTNGATFSGSSLVVKGRTHSNRDLKVSGSSHTFTGGTEYVNNLNVSGSANTFTPGATRVAVSGFPVTYSLTNYRPAGSAAVAAGPSFHDMTASCTGSGANRKWSPSGQLAAGLYYANCGVQISGSSFSANKVTIAAEGPIKVSGSSNAFVAPFVPEGLLFITGDGSANAIDLSGSSQTYGGALFAGSGGISVSGSSNKFVCGLQADTIGISGSSSTIDTTTCPFAGTTTITVAAPPLLVPTLGSTITPSATSVVPGQALTYTETTANQGARLLVPGVAAASNTAATSATVTAANVAVDYYDLATASWKTLAASNPPVGTITASNLPNNATGVAYPAGGDHVAGTTIAAGQTASWATIATITLTPAQVTALLDPTKVSAVRAHVDLTTTGGAVRSSWRFAANLLGQLSTETGNLTDVKLTVLPPVANPITYTAPGTPGFATVTPGQVVTTTTSVNVATPTTRNPAETDTAYLARLKALDGTTIAAFAQPEATAGVGKIYAPGVIATTTVHVPILTATLTGPARVVAGSGAAFTATVTNTGSAPAASPNLTVTTTGVGAATIAPPGLPPVIAPGQTVTVTATLAVPAGVSTSEQTATGSLTWSASGATVVYGPVNPTASFHLVGTQGDPTLALTPANAGPNPTGAAQTLTALAKDGSGTAVANLPITFTITGVNAAASGSATTDADGQATFTYTGTNAGTDAITAAATIDTIAVTGGPATIGWTPGTQPVSVPGVNGRFFPAAPDATSFTATPADTPSFAQSFPNIAFNPPTNVVPGNTTVTPATQPFTDVTVDSSGHAAGTTAATGNGHQAGSGDLASFQAALDGTLQVGQPGDLTFSVIADDGFVFGVEGGSRVAGVNDATPARTPFDNYPVIGGHDQPSLAPSTYAITIHFPAAGSYRFELDYFTGTNTSMTLVLDATTGRQQTSTITVPATADIFGAGHVTAPSPGGDVYPGPSLPVEPGYALTPGGTISFPGTSGDTTAYGGCGGPHATADGVANENTDIQSWNGISGIVDHSAQQFLVGVFVDDSEPLGNPPNPDAPPAPDRLDFSGNHDFPDLSPQLHQTFFIGDGLTAAGALQRFHVPLGATRLFVGMADAFGFHGLPGWYGDNCGQFILNAQSTPSTVVPPSIPSGYSAPVMTTAVHANFFASDQAATAFTATPATPPAFTQTFPNIAFDPPVGVIANAPAGVTSSTRPFTDVTLDPAGAPTGKIVAQGNGHQAGSGDLTSFQASMTSSFVVSQAGDATISLNANAGWVLGVGGGATRVSGPQINAPASGTTAFTGVSVLGASNQPGPATPAQSVVVHFPTPGTYPYELDYFAPTGPELSLVMNLTTTPTPPVQVSTAYADTPPTASPRQARSPHPSVRVLRPRSSATLPRMTPGRSGSTTRATRPSPSARSPSTSAPTTTTRGAGPTSRSPPTDPSC